MTTKKLEMENFPITLIGEDLMEGDEVLAEVLLEAALEHGDPTVRLSVEDIEDRMRAKGWVLKDGELVRSDG